MNRIEIIENGDEYNRIDISNGSSWYQDEDGNTYSSKSDYVQTIREQKLNEILK